MDNSLEPQIQTLPPASSTRIQTGSRDRKSLERQITRVRAIRLETLYEIKTNLLYFIQWSRAKWLSKKKEKSIRTSIHQIWFFAPPNTSPGPLQSPTTSIVDANDTPKTPAQQPSSTAAATISPIGFEKKKKAQNRSAFQTSQKGSLPFWPVGPKLTAQKHGLENTWHTIIVSRRYPKKEEGNKTYLVQGPVSNVFHHHQAYRKLA